MPAVFREREGGEMRSGIEVKKKKKVFPLVAAAITMAGFHVNYKEIASCFSFHFRRYVGTHHVSCTSTGVVFVIIIVLGFRF